MKRFIRSSSHQISADKRLAPTSEKYKGYRISLLNDSSGYAVFDKHGEMEDHGFKSTRDAKLFIDGLIMEDVQSSTHFRNTKITNLDQGLSLAEDRLQVIGLYALSIFLDNDSTYSMNIRADVGEISDVSWAVSGIHPDATAEEIADIVVTEAPNKLKGVISTTSVFTDHCENCEWQELASKQIPDSDGFLTDYTLYTDGVNFICMFGDKDLYEPSYDYADFDTVDEEDAWNWFNNYTGFEDDDIYGAVDAEAEDDIEDLTLVDQEYDSAKTSINSKNLPAVYNMISLPAGSVGVDFGGGKFDNAVEYLADQDVTLYVYDPYNRSAEHNREVLKALRANGGADFAINSNVLNVIKEPEARRNVLENLKKITKPGAPIYITVYEGSGKGNEGPTKSGYQLNRKTADYLEEVQEVFPDANRKSKLITAINSSKAVDASYKLGDTVFWNRRLYTIIDDSDEDSMILRPADLIDDSAFNDEYEAGPDDIYLAKFQIGSAKDIASVAHNVKVTGGSCDRKWIYDTMQEGIDMSFVINGVACVFRFFANHGRYVVNGIDCNMIIIADRHLDITHSGGSSRSYLLNVPGNIMTSEPKTNQKDFKFTGQYYSTSPVVKYVKSKLKQLFQENVEDFDSEVLDLLKISSATSSETVTSAVIDDRYVTIDEVIEHVSTLVFGAADRYFHDIGYDIDYAYYDITQEDHSRIKVEIRTEMEYEELEALAEALNPVVEDLDNDSYFEPVTYGIIEAYVSIRKVALVMGYRYTPSSTLDASAKIESAWDDIPEPNLDPPEYDEGEEVETEATCDFEAINVKVTVDEDGSWEYETIEFLNPYRDKVWTSEEYDVEIGDASDIIEDFDEIIEPHIPGAAGVYYMNGKGDLIYNISGIRIVTTDGWFDERSGWEYDEEVYKDDVDIDFDKDKSSIDVIFTESPIIK